MAEIDGAGNALQGLMKDSTSQAGHNTALSFLFTRTFWRRKPFKNIMGMLSLMSEEHFPPERLSHYFTS